MTHIIKNNTLEIAVDLPLENYEGSRFDWSGKISSVRFENLPLTTIAVSYTHLTLPTIYSV